LTDNRNILGTLLQNSALSLVAKLVYQFGNAFLFFLIARRYGSGEAGVYTLASKYYLLSLTFSLWGLDGVLIWRVATDRSLTWRYFFNFSLLRLCLSIITYVAVAVSATGYDLHTARVILWLALAIIPDGISRLIQSIFVTHGYFVYPAIVSLIGSCLRCVLSGFIIWSNGSLEAIAFVQVVTAWIGLLMYIAFSWDILHFQHNRKRWQELVSWDFMLQHLRLSISFALAEIFFTIEGQIDAVILSFYLPQNQVGIYGAAQSLILPISFAFYAYDVALYPLMARLYAHERPYLWTLYQRLFLYTGLIIFPVAITLSTLTQVVVIWVYKEQFISAAVVSQWLIWSVVLQFFNEPNSRLVVIAGYPKVITVILGMSMITNILLNCFLIPRFGILGSAWARLFSTLLFAILNSIFVFDRIVRINPLPIVGKPVLAALVWGAALYFCRPFALGVRLALGGICYLAVIFLTQPVSVRDLRALWRTITSSLRG
jgi:O-antigen/teichoic acid export membrane protein